ncbi:MAG: sigma-70 family RNA polymerase sigma factor [Lachnospira sp.]|nr:sigma-70 family RNA polymerase sigma factor [Lachnospira sp.]
MNVSTKLKDAIKDYKKGNERAFEIIYQESNAYIYTCIKNKLKPEYQKEDFIRDIMQDTYLLISEDIRKLISVNSFFGWAKTIAHRKVYAALKQEDKYVLLKDDENFDNLLDESNIIPEDIVVDQEKQQKIRNAVNNKLTKDEKSCVIGYYYNDMKQKDIAKELDMPENTVKSNIFRAKSKLRSALEKVMFVAIGAGIAIFFMKMDDVKHLVSLKGVIKNNNDDRIQTQKKVGVIPNGCAYYDCSEDVLLEAGQEFPMYSSYDDKYYTNDYVYTYVVGAVNGVSKLKWKVAVKDTTKEFYEDIQESINGEAIIEINGTFENCTNMIEAPKIPDHVQSIEKAFKNCKSLKKAPKIPYTVRNMKEAFRGCESMVEMTAIPEGVEDITCTFYNCKSLINAPKLPETITKMTETFYKCESLVNAPHISKNVEYINGTFWGCTSLTGEIVIDTYTSYYAHCFEDVDFEAQGIVLSGRSFNLKEIKETGK